jgi:sterol 3beta-glucosyltransferase
MAPSSADINTSEDVARGRLSKKLRKKRKEEHQPTMELPDRLKDTGDEMDEDVVPHHGGHQMFMNMNQSIFGLLAAAGSNVDFNDRFESQSSDEDEDRLPGHPGGRDSGSGSNKKEDVSRSQVIQKSSSDKTDKRHRRKISDQLLRSLPHLPRLSSKSKSKSSKLKGPPIAATTPEEHETLSPTDESSGVRSPDLETTRDDRDGRTAPVMSRMLEARAEMTARPSFDLERLSGDHKRSGDEADNDSALARRLKEIFEFDQPEKVLEGRILPSQACYRPSANISLQNTLAGSCKVYSCRGTCISPRSTSVSMPISPRKRLVGASPVRPQ